ncbi:MAG: methylenetetrahydrofolate reductase [NAD(P)H] [Phycisphaerales bacterium]
MIRQLLDQSTTFSFEFFPPKDEVGAQRLFDNIVTLEGLGPDFVSITYGAGGSTRKLTRDVVHKVKSQTGIATMPHLTCVGHSDIEINEILEGYAQRGISDILALRGDPPKGGYMSTEDDFQYASQLVSYIDKFNDRHASSGFKGFGIGVAGFPEGHPGTANRLTEMEHLKAKVDAGADFVVTQMFFENRDYFDFCDRCILGKVKVPVIAGIMPVQSISGMKRMADLALGMRFPASLLRAVRRTDGSDDSIRRVGVHWATEQCRDLLDHGSRGIHFYTLNKSNATLEIYRSLGVQNSRQLSGGDLLPF